MKKLMVFLFVFPLVKLAFPQASVSLKDQYTKIERLIPMRDGINLFTAIYLPKEQSEKFPFLMMRTPYSCFPYGEANYPPPVGAKPVVCKSKIYLCNSGCKRPVHERRNF